MSADWDEITMAEFAGRMLSSFVDRPVVDKTGREGRFNVHLEFVLPRATGVISLNGQEMPAPGAEAAAEPSGPTIFTALQKLGLKLSPGKSALDVLVVDHVERPSENGSLCSPSGFARESGGERSLAVRCRV